MLDEAKYWHIPSLASHRPPLERLWLPVAFELVKPRAPPLWPLRLTVNRLRGQIVNETALKQSLPEFDALALMQRYDWQLTKCWANC